MCCRRVRAVCRRIRPYPVRLCRQHIAAEIRRSLGGVAPGISWRPRHCGTDEGEQFASRQCYAVHAHVGGSEHRGVHAGVQRLYRVFCGLIRHYGGPNVIVCGDFNDVPGSYPVRSFADAGFQSVYPKIGFGPIIRRRLRTPWSPCWCAAAVSGILRVCIGRGR